MKRLLTIAATLCLGASAVVADTAFDRARISTSASQIVCSGCTGPTDYFIRNSADVAFSFGQTGFQFSGGILTNTDFTDSLSLSDVYFHGYNQSGNGRKIGLFAQNLFIVGHYGVEAMFETPTADFEFSLGKFSGLYQEDVYSYLAAVYLKPGERLELYGVVEGLTNGADHYTFYTFGGSHFLGGGSSSFWGNGTALEFSYSVFPDISSDFGVIRVGLGWDIGGKSDSRFFRQRDILSIEFASFD